MVVANTLTAASPEPQRIPDHADSGYFSRGAAMIGVLLLADHRRGRDGAVLGQRGRECAAAAGDAAVSVLATTKVRSLAPFLRGEGWGEGLLPRIQSNMRLAESPPHPESEDVLDSSHLSRKRGEVRDGTHGEDLMQRITITIEDDLLAEIDAAAEGAATRTAPRSSATSPAPGCNNPARTRRIPAHASPASSMSTTTPRAIFKTPGAGISTAITISRWRRCMSISTTTIAWR